MFTATLDCGTVLSFEARSFLPTRGELVPCRHHGYCAVDAAGTSPGAASRYLRRSRSRSQRELVEWLRHQHETTVHALRRERFTLRMLTQAERAGLVELDLVSGRVAIRPAPGSDTLPSHGRSVSAAE